MNHWFWVITIPILAWSIYDDLKYLKEEISPDIIRRELLILPCVLVLMGLLTKLLSVPWAIIIALLTWTCYTDVRYRIIPNTVVFALIAIGIYNNSFQVLLSMFACFLIFTPFIFRGGIGLGDMKLTAGMGAALGYGPAINILLYSLLLALIYVFLKKLREGKVKQWLSDSNFALKTSLMTGHIKLETPTDQKELKGVTVPLGAFFLPGAIIFYLFGMF